MKLLAKAVGIACIVATFAGGGIRADAVQKMRVDAVPATQQLVAAMKQGFALPMTFLYRADGSSVPADRWPGALAAVGKDFPNPSACLGKPGEQCVQAPLDKRLAEHFVELQDRETGRPVMYKGLPRHEWLLVEYGADWCAPCKKERAAIQRALAGRDAVPGVVWLSIDYSASMTLDAQ